MMQGFWAATSLAQTATGDGRVACPVSGCLGFVDLGGTLDHVETGTCVSCGTWFFQCADCRELIDDPDIGYTTCPGCEAVWLVEATEDHPVVSRLEPPF
jgi:hypothetical protein